MIVTRKELLYHLIINPKWSILRHLLLQVVIILITSVVFNNRESNTITFDSNSIKGWLCFYTSLNIAIYLNIYFLTPQYMLKGKLSHYFTYFFIYSTILALIVNGAHFYFCPPDGFSQKELTILFTMLMFSSYVNYGMLETSTSSFLLLQVWVRNKIKQEELEISTLNAKLKILRNQINPHFLFNTINNVNTMMKRDPVSASYILKKLKDLLHYQISNASKKFVALNDEIKLLDNYLHLEKIRRDNFIYKIKIDGNTDNVLLPPLLFINFVENAVKYNPNDGSEIIVSFTKNNNELLFQCQNTKSEIIEKHEVGGIGLANIKKRLELLFPTSHTLNVKETNNMFIVNLSIKV